MIDDVTLPSCDLRGLITKRSYVQPQNVLSSNVFVRCARVIAAMSSNCLAACFLVSALFVWCRQPPVAVGLQCPGCGDKRRCPSVSGCPAGTVPDPCGCCLECARVANESCGGRFRANGRCDEGLVCVITPPPGSVITGEEIGICRGRPFF